MTITRISAAELFSKPHEFTPQEEAAFAEMTDEGLEKTALSDPDAQPVTSEMLLRGGQNRRSRLRLEALREASLGAKLSRADDDLELPLFEMTDEHGRTILLKALACREVARPHDPAARILKLETVIAGRASPAPEDKAEARARLPERQTS